MAITRRSTLSGLAAFALSATISGCGAANHAKPTKTRVYVLGTIHGNHRESERYSLEVLESAIRKARPDRILAEIPPDRIIEAYRSFREEGKVTEPRTRVFPEYVDVAFPLSRELGFEIIPTAGWTQKIADDRRAALSQIEQNPARVEQWQEHISARRLFTRLTRGRRDDPLFIHTAAYDRLVRQAQAPYQEYFEADLGAGGWIAINAAHNRLINAALDEISGQGLTALITFGAWHKYKILESLEQRDDIELLDSRMLFEG